jgi:purine-nucleoside phosphorylase
MARRGASYFTDAALLLCNIPNVKEILFLGIGAGIGNKCRSRDIHISEYCSRYEQVANHFVGSEFIAALDTVLRKEIIGLIKKINSNDDVRVYSETHASLPFLFSETEAFFNIILSWGLGMDLNE